MPKMLELIDFKVGMELASPIKNKYGQLLIPEGTKLEERHKTILLTWGIQSFYIKDEEENYEVQYDEETISSVKEILKKRINWNFRNNNEEELYNLALTELLKKRNTN